MTVLGVGGGFVPPTPQPGRARMHAILPTWADVKRSQVKAWQYILDVGVDSVQCFNLIWHLVVVGIWLAPPHHLGRACTLTSTHLKKLNIHC
jgi:hypothetical protein